MEREKSRETERVKEIREREQQLRLKKLAEQQAMDELQALKQKGGRGQHEATHSSEDEEDEAEAEGGQELVRAKFAPVVVKQRTPEETVSGARGIGCMQGWPVANNWHKFINYMSQTNCLKLSQMSQRQKVTVFLLGTHFSYEKLCSCTYPVFSLRLIVALLQIL